jgi:arylsulfatase A-like enzyme/Tfp pilus assembly protein PilF
MIPDRGERGAGPPGGARRRASRLLALLGTLGIAGIIALACRGPLREATPAGAPAGGRRNLLLVTLDTVRADHLGAYGDAAAETPSLDRLAREGVRFAAAASPVPLTLPAHSSLLSGLLPPHHGLRNNGAASFPADLPTLATRLSAAGYGTGAFVGSFVLDHRFGLARGFDVYDDEMERDASGGRGLDAERRGDRVVDRALAWLQAGRETEKPAGKPFFLWVHLYDAHAPYTPPAPYRDRHPGKPYDGEIAFADAQVGRLLAELDRLHLAAGTVVAVAADHGEALGEHGELTHGLLLYEPTLHVPLLLRAPGLAAGKIVATPVSLVDLAPTLAGLLGQPWGDPRDTSHPLDGRDLSAALLRGEEPPAGDLYAETHYPEIFGWSPLTALRRRELKYIQAPRPELYDLGRDPGEAANLAAKPETAGPTRGFAERLASLQSSARAANATGIAPALDAEARARLESLGYAGGGKAAATAATAATAASLADPKDRVALFRRYEEANSDLRDAGDKSGHRAGEALTILAAIVAADPRNPVFRGKLAQVYRERGDYGRAIPLYRQAAESAPADSEAWYNLGVTLEEAGQAAAATEILTRAVRLDPTRPEEHNSLGIAFLTEGHTAEAEREFEQAITLDPGDARAYNNLGNVRRATGRLDEALAAYRQATTLAPRYAEAWNGMGTLAVDRNRPQEALACFDRALALAPGYHEVRLNRAIAYEMAGDTQAARAAYREFLAATGNDPQYRTQRRAAEQLLARLTDREAGSTKAERR